MLKSPLFPQSNPIPTLSSETATAMGSAYVFPEYLENVLQGIYVLMSNFCAVLCVVPHSG